MRKIDLLRLAFKAAKEAGTLSDPTMTFKAYQVEQALIAEFSQNEVQDKSAIDAGEFFDMDASIAALELDDPIILAPMVIEQFPEYIPQSPQIPEADSFVIQAQQLLGFVDDALDAIDSTAIRLQDEVRTHIPDVSDVPEKKTVIARRIFTLELDKSVDEGREMNRQTVINLFMSVVHLSKNGANTYYQNNRREHGMIG